MKVLTIGYAHDIGIQTRATNQSATENNQKAVGSLNIWLQRSKSMKAKSKKCVAIALSKGKATEPNLTIEGNRKAAPIARISDGTYDGKSHDPWFKHLGRILSENLCEDRAKDRLIAMVHRAESTIGKVPLEGSQKVWIWDSYVTAQISWVSLINDIAPTCVDTLQAIQTRCFKKWLGYARTVNSSIFYWSVTTAS